MNFPLVANSVSLDVSLVKNLLKKFVLFNPDFNQVVVKRINQLLLMAEHMTGNWDLTNEFKVPEGTTKSWKEMDEEEKELGVEFP